MSETSIMPMPKATVVPANEAAWELQQTSQTAPSGLEVVRIPIPASIESLTPLQVAIIMQSQPMWSAYDIPFLFYVQLRCKQLNLDPMSGDVYAIEGRLSTSDDAKINAGRTSGKIKWSKVTQPLLGEHPINGGKDFYVDAEIQHADEDQPQTYRAWFSEWNNPKNANWAKRPVESLQRKAMARLSHRMFPMTDAEDFEAPATNGLMASSDFHVAQQLRSAVMALPDAELIKEPTKSNA
jgi:hypothetical protein